MSTGYTKLLQDMEVRIQVVAVLLLSAVLAPSAGRAQSCPEGAYCEGWDRDSTRREVTLSRTAVCALSCPATCSTAPITALPSIRVGSLDHVVLGFAVSDACVPECTSPPAEPCWNLGVSYRRLVASGTEGVTGTYDCDPLGDPGTVVSAGATFSATYEGGGTDNIAISNIVYGLGIGPDDCGAFPSSLDLVATGPTLAIQSHFTFSWLTDVINVGNSRVTGYTETRTYTSLPPPNTVHITVTNIDYVAKTYTVSVPDATTPALRRSWGALKVRYR